MAWQIPSQPRVKKFLRWIIFPFYMNQRPPSTAKIKCAWLIYNDRGEVAGARGALVRNLALTGSQFVIVLLASYEFVILHTDSYCRKLGPCTHIRPIYKDAHAVDQTSRKKFGFRQTLFSNVRKLLYTLCNHRKQTFIIYKIIHLQK